MAISSNNNFATNKLVTMVAIRAAEAAGYLTVGSKKYFANQLVGKNNGQDYDFYIRDTGDAVNRLAYMEGDKIALSERKVTLSLDPWHVLINTNAIEKATDIEDWEDEIAKPNGQKLIQGVVRKAIENDLGKVGTAFIGAGFTPLSQAAAHLASVVSEDLYGFVDPNVEAILTSNGQQFVPVDAPDMYSKGLLGRFHGAEYRSQRWLPVLNLTSAVSNALNAAKVTNVAVNGTSAGVWDVTISGANLSGAKVPKALPIFIDGVKACDTVGDPTSMDQAFITLDDVTFGGTAATATVHVRAKDITKGGTREIAKEDGTSFSAVSAVTGNIAVPEAGKYFTGIVRADGSYEFETMDKIDAAGAEYAKSPVVEGLTVHQNRLVDLRNMTDDTRWDIVTLAGTVEPRSVAMFYVR